MTKSRSGELPGTATHRQVTDAAPPSRLAAVRALALALLAFAAAAALIALWPGAP